MGNTKWVCASRMTAVAVAVVTKYPFWFQASLSFALVYPLSPHPFLSSLAIMLEDTRALEAAQPLDRSRRGGILDPANPARMTPRS